MDRLKETMSTSGSAVHSKSVNAHVENYLNYYCTSEIGPGFAVLLKGDWGVGKTWFIKNYFKQVDNRWGKPIYISLYGVSRTSQIEEKIFEALHPLFASKPAKLAGVVVKGLIKTTIQVDLDKDNRNDGSYSLQIPEINLPGFLNNLEKRVLVFDDLERCKLDVDSVLGYINTYVEEQRSKVIILANEDEIDSKYSGVKEKVVGQTLTVRFDLHGAIRPFSSAITSEAAKRSLVTNAALIEEIYTIADYENLRSLKQIMSNFERIYMVLPSEAQATPEVIKDLIRSLTALTIEVQKGDLSAKEIGDLVKHSAESRVAKNVPPNDKNIDNEASKKASSVFLEKYNFFFHSLFPGEAWWQRFFDEGVLDIEGLVSAFESSTYFQNANLPDWTKLWHFPSLTDEEFRKLLPRVASDFKSQKFEDVRIVRHVFGVLLNLSCKELYEKSPKQILEEGREYVETLIDRAYANGLTDLFASADMLVKILGSAYGSTGSFGLAYRGSDYAEFKAFEVYVSEYGEAVNQKHLPSVADELLVLMQSDIWKFKRILCLGQYDTDEVKSYYNVPILKFVDVNEFVNSIVELRSYEDLCLVGYALKERYSYTNHGLEPEIDWLQALGEKVASEIDNRKKTIIGYRLKVFNAEYIDPIVEKIRNSLCSDSTSQ